MISGTTDNVSSLKIKTDFLNTGDSISLVIDSVKIKTVVNQHREVWLSGFPEWKVVGEVNPKHKNPSRSGTFKEAFNHRMVFVYGTHGTKDENAWAFNKARFDAEVWYYRGNGSIDVISDSQFEPLKFKDRGVIIYGNAITNSAWNKLLKKCPVTIAKERVVIGDKVLEGTDLGCYFTWPREDSNVAMVAVVGGTGLIGMKSTDPNQYFAAGSGFPDYLVFSAEMLNSGAVGIRAAGFFDNEWRLPEKSSN